MTNRTSMGLLLASVLMAATMVAGCGGSGSGGAADLGDWTLQTDGLTLTKELQVSETENYFFGSIEDLHVANDGRMFVADEHAHNIKVLAPDGTLRDSIGRPGAGPREFRNLKNVQIARRDSLYAYDMQLSRITVLASNAPYEEYRTIILSRENGIPFRIHVVKKGFVTRLITPVRPEPGVSRTAPRIWRKVGESGTLGDTLLTTPGPRVLATETGFRPIPLNTPVIHAWGPNGRLYYGNTDRLHIKSRSFDGSTKVVASIPTEPVPLSEADRDSLLAKLDGKMQSKMASALPDSKPAFMQMVVSDEGRIWVERPTKASVSQHRWWILNPESKIIHEVHLPSDVDLAVIQNGKAYGTTDTDMGAPAVVRYRIDSSS